MNAIKYVILAIAILMYALVIAFQNKKVWFTSAAAVIVIILGMILPNVIFPLKDSGISLVANGSLYALTHSLFEIINWNVIMIYLGSMTIAALFLY